MRKAKDREALTDEQEQVEAVDRAFLLAAVYHNSFKALAPTANVTGFRTNSLRHRALDQRGLRRCAETFLVNSRLMRNDRETEVSIESYFSDPGLVMLSLGGKHPADESDLLPLPPSIDLPIGFSELVRSRRSIRSYTGDPWTLRQLATIIRAAAGVTGIADAPLLSGGEVSFKHRAAPSGGGVYAVDLYVAALAVDDLARGIYRYEPVRDGLTLVGDDTQADAFLATFTVPDELISLSRATAVFVLVGQPWRAMRKYGNRGLRLIFLEAGAIAEHINLAATAFGFGSVDCASYVDDESHVVLNIDGLYHAILHTVVAGCRT